MTRQVYTFLAIMLLWHFVLLGHVGWGNVGTQCNAPEHYTRGNLHEGCIMISIVNSY